MPENTREGRLKNVAPYNTPEGRLKYVAPYNTPEECDHEGAPEGGCSHCCPCEECGSIRADNVIENDD